MNTVNKLFLLVMSMLCKCRVQIYGHRIRYVEASDHTTNHHTRNKELPITYTDHTS